MKQILTKRVSVFMIILLIIMQSIPVGNMSYASTVKGNHFDVQVEKGSVDNQAIVTIIQKDVNYDSVNILLPAGVVYDKTVTNDIAEEHINKSYDENSHSLTISNIDQNDVSFVLTNVTTDDYRLSIQGITEEEIAVEEIYDFTIQQSIGVEESDTPEESNNEQKSEESKKDSSKEIDEEKTKPSTHKDASEVGEDSSSEEDAKKATQESLSDDQQTKVSEETTGDLNVYMKIEPVYETALSGDDANFILTLKLTGAKRTYKNVDVFIDLPDAEHVAFDGSQEQLDRMAISGVSPTFDQETNQIHYHFEAIERGRMYEQIISLHTENGYIPNETPLELIASINGDIHYTENDENEEAQKGDIIPFEFDDQATMNMLASGALSLSKIQVDENGANQANRAIVKADDEVLWKLELEIPKKERGQLFLQPEQKIVITDTLPDDLDYMNVVSGNEPVSVNGQTITWEFDVADFSLQEEKGETLFEEEIIIQTKVKSSAEIGELINTANADATFIEDTQVTNRASRGIVVAEDNPSTGTIEGTIYIPAHYGPGGNNDIKNPNRSITDDTILRFTHSVSPLRESFPDGYNNGNGAIKEYQLYKTVYDIDRNLNLEFLVPPSQFQFKPTSGTTPYLLAEQPTFDIIAEFYGNTPSRTLVSAEDLIFKKEYDRDELGLAPEEKVKTIIYDFGNYPGGVSSQNWAEYKFSIDEGFRGEVENKFNVIGVDGNGVPFNHREKYPDNYENGNDRDVSGPRQTTVVGYGENPKPVGRVGVKLLEDVQGVVTQGQNRMQVELTNVNNSGAPMNHQLESVVLLPPGVTLHGEVNPSYTDAQGNPTDAASYEVIDEDYNGSGRQLVHIKWDDNRITKGQKLQAELDVFISEQAPNQLMFDVYGFSSDEGLLAPSNTEGGITDTVLQIDTEDLNGNGNTSQPRLKSGNLYSLAGTYDIQTEKLIKGPNDKEYSKFTTAPFEGTVDYKLKMTNTTGKNLSMMTLIDILPTIGDLGITDNISRGSMFEPILEGPITLPAEWEGKVNVFYSTAKNPERDDLTRHTEYLPNAPQLTNPEGAESPNWIAASEVTDWSTIHSLKIELQKGDEWIKGQDIEIDFSMRMPEEPNVPEEAKNLDLVPHQRAAWNSFAVSTDTGHPVEPERVGVALELAPPETPDVEKEVENNDGSYGKDLVEKERGKEYNYRVTTIVPEDLRGFEHITLADDLDKRLDLISAVALVDGEQVDYEVVIEGQLVTLKVDREQLDAIAGQSLTLQITAQIKEGVKVEVIDNEATIQVNNYPVENSNKVPVIPPPETPDVEKEVENNDGSYGKDLVEKERKKDYNYRVTTVVPEDLSGFEHIILADDLDERLDVISAVALVDGEKVDYEVVIEGQLVTLQVDREQLDAIAGQSLTLQITAQIKADVKVEVIDNEATIQVNNYPAENSNKVPVVPPPPEVPHIEKDVEGEVHLDIDYNKEYNYNIITTLPMGIEDYEEFIITDQVDSGLVVDGDNVQVTVDGKVYDGLLVTVNGNLVKVEVTDFTGLKGKRQIELSIPAKIHSETNMNDYKDHKIPNTATLHFTNALGEKGEITTDPVTVTPLSPKLVVEDELGSKLPKTATQVFNVMFIGFILVLIGFSSLFIRRRLKQ